MRKYLVRVVSEYEYVIEVEGGDTAIAPIEVTGKASADEATEEESTEETSEESTEESAEESTEEESAE